MGYRDYAKDYEIRYEEREGRKRPKAVRVYIGPWFRFVQPPQRIRRLRWFYLVLLFLTAAFLLIPMCIDCGFTRTWYIQVPAAVAWIPWLLSGGAVWRLWTAGEQVNREHYELLHDRMSSSCLFLMGFFLISCVGCAVKLSEGSAAPADYLVCLSNMAGGISAMAMFSQRKALEMTRAE